jgi:hypothetical protein
MRALLQPYLQAHEQLLSAVHGKQQLVHTDLSPCRQSLDMTESYPWLTDKS